MLLGFAEVSTGAQLEKITRAFRRCNRAQQEQADKRDAARYLRWHWDDDGNLVGQFCLPPEAGAPMIKAIESRVSPEDLKDADRDGARDPYSAVRADALVELVAAGLHAEELPSGSDVLVSIITEQRVLESVEGDTAESEEGVCEIVDGPGLARETALRLTCDATTVEVVEDAAGNVINVGRRTRRINRRMRHALRLRDHSCQFPGCNRAGRQGHHLHHWTNGGPTNLDNLVNLCWRHHRRVHEGGYRVERDSERRWVFYNEYGRKLSSIVTPADPAEVNSTWPEPAPYQDGWDGTRLDLHTTTGCLLHEELGPAFCA